MKLLCAIGLLLLSCGVGEAQQDLYTDCIKTDPSGKTYDICRMPDMRKILSESQPLEIVTCNENITKCETPCEKKMREAMKLISPYIDYGDTSTMVDALYRSPQTRLREEADRLDKRDAAVRKWNKIYEECVK